MEFELRLCLALGKTLQELRRSANLEEYALWHAFELTHGLPLQRVEAAVALSGAAMCQSWGSKIKPKDLMPKYEAPQVLSYKDGAEIFAAMAKRHNERTTRRTT